jgi:hypothetical protein
MNKLLMYPVFAASLLLSQCSMNHDSPVVATDGTKTVEIAIATKDGFDTIASGALAKVSGRDMKMMECKLQIGASKISGQIDNIPLGTDRIFEVLVYDFSGNVIYYGSDTADVEVGRITYVHIVLRKVNGGTAVINGSFDDIYAPCTSIWFTTMMGFVADRNYEKKTATAALIVCGMSSHYRNYYPDTLEFSYVIKSLYNQAKIDWRRGNQDVITDRVTFDCLLDDQIKMYAYARCTKHPQTIGVDSVTINVVNGSGTGVWNSIYPYAYADTIEYDMSPADTKKLSFKSGDVVSVHIEGTWCMSSKDFCWTANGGKGGEGAGNRFLYPELPAGGFLIKSTEYEEFGVFNGTDNFYMDKDGELTFFANRLLPVEQGKESGTIHVYIIRKGGTVIMPGD